MKRPILLARFVGWSALLAIALAGRTAWSEDTSDLDALLGETVSSTASKSTQASTVVPAHTLNITAEDLRRHGIRTLAEAYDFLALSIVSQDALGDVEVGSRGVLFTNDAGKHLLLMIDGHVTNDQRNGASYHGRSAGMPIEIIDHIEIMLGPGSVLYGANATLGVVNVITKKAADFDGLHLIAEGTVSPAQDQAHLPIAPRLTGDSLGALGTAYRVGLGYGRGFRLLGRPGELTFQVEYSDLKGPDLAWTPVTTGNYSGPYSPQPGVWGGITRHSFYERTPSGYLRLVWNDLQLTLHGVASRLSTPYSRAQDVGRDFDDPISYSDRGYGAIDLSWSHSLSARSSLQARVYGDASQDYAQVHSSNLIACLGSQLNGCIHTSAGHGGWLGAELQTTIEWLSDLSMSTQLGTEGRVRRVGFESGIKDASTGAPVAAFGQYAETGTAVAIYGQQIYNPLPSLTFNGGARWDFDSGFGNRISPRAAVVVDVWHGGTAKVIYSEAFRPPTTEELHLTNRYLVLASPDLAPEIVRSAEVMIQQRIGTQRMIFGVFASRWDNVVSRETLSQADLSAGQRAGLLDSSATRAFQFRNVARVISYGMDGTYERGGSNSRVTYGVNLTAAYARVDVGGESQTMTVTPSVYGNAHLSYDLRGRLPVLSVASHVSSKRTADNAHSPGVTTIQYAAPEAVFRLTASGHIPRLDALKYRLSASYGLAGSAPFAASVSSNDRNITELVPAIRAVVLLGLQYDF